MRVNSTSSSFQTSNALPAPPTSASTTGSTPPRHSTSLAEQNCYEQCIQQEEEDALYFAVYGDANVCGCGNSAAFFDATDKPEGVCDIICPGDTTQICGGSSSYQLYHIRECGCVGWFGLVGPVMRKVTAI